MLTSLQRLIDNYGMRISGVLHVGAHIGEEAEDYNNAGIREVLWVEANPEMMVRLWEHVGPYGHKTANVAVGAACGNTVLHVMNNMMSSSVLPLGTHALRAPQCVYTHDVEVPMVTVDTLCSELVFHNFNMINMDIQGAELMALSGAHEALQHTDYVFTEVNFDELYLGCARVWELDQLLWAYRFYRAETWIAQGNVGWGDALYVRESVTR